MAAVCPLKTTFAVGSWAEARRTKSPVVKTAAQTREVRMKRPRRGAGRWEGGLSHRTEGASTGSPGAEGWGQSARSNGKKLSAPALTSRSRPDRAGLRYRAG